MAALGMLLVASPVAQAGTGFGFGFGFSSPEGFEGPVGVAVDGSAGSSAGDVYVVDQGNDAVKKFRVSGGVATQLWKVELPAGETPNQATVDDFAGADQGDVFVAGYGRGVVYRINPAGTQLAEVLSGVPNPTGVAVDSAGRFFVSSIAEGAVLEYSASWKPIDAAGLPVSEGENKVVEGLSGPQTLAVDPTGENIYAATEAGTIQATLVAGSYMPSTLDGAPSTGVTVGPSGDVFVDHGNEVAFYEPSGTLLGSFGSRALSGSAYGIAAATGAAYVADHERNEVDVFEEGPTPETPQVSEASDVKGHSAILHGKLTLASGETKLKYFFEYNAGPSCAGGSTTPVREGAAEVSAEVTGLSLRTEYTFCLQAENKVGEAASSPETFETDAVGSENSPTVTAREAAVTAEIATAEEPTTYRVQYGVGSVEEDSVPVPEADIAGSRVPTVVLQALDGLEPATTYHYRFLATNGGGLATGEERTFTTAAAAIPPAESCNNAKLRAEQPYGLALPDCRAYEMVSPADTNGQDAVIAASFGVRASLGGGAIAYASAGAFANAEGTGQNTELLSRREAEGWTTQAITPLQEPRGSEGGDPSYEGSLFTPELTAGIATSTAPLAGTGAPLNPLGEKPRRKLYLAQLPGGAAEPSYSYVGQLGSGDTIRVAMGASTDLSHVVFGEGIASEWVNGSVSPVGIVNNGETVPSSVGNAAPNGQQAAEVDAWHAVSSDGKRVYFTSPATTEGSEPPAELYLRMNADQPQSAIAHPEANATGNLSEGSHVITAITPVHAQERLADLEAGSTAVKLYEATPGDHDPYPFAVGQPVSGSGIAAGTKIVAVSTESLTLSAPATASASEVLITSTRADSFAIGEQISGYGLAAGTTVTAVGSGTVTLSTSPDVSASGVALAGGGECVEAAKACTVEVSASERTASDTHGAQAARYWGASANGARVFFTSAARLTNDAMTGPADSAENLYEYDLERPADERLKDLTVDAVDTDGAGVLGVVQVSEDGEYVYFVADGALAAGAVPGEPNLYVTHDGGTPAFIATLTAGDEGDWHAGLTSGGPAINTAAVSPSGALLAFMSEGSLTGYDNQQAEPGECERHSQFLAELHVDETGDCREVYLYDAETNAPVVCVSCNSSGGRPQGPAGLNEGALSETAASSYRPRNFSEDGVLFFNSSAALVPSAVGGVGNVYEYEGGHVDPISDVAGSHESVFLDASASGGDVFFATVADLVSQDTGRNVVVYDARVGGGYPAAPVPPPACSNEACKPSPSPQPALGPPASATAVSEGNVTSKATVKPKPKAMTRAQKLAAALKACRRDTKKAKREACEKRAKARYGPSKKKTAKKSSNRKGGK